MSEPIRVFKKGELVVADPTRRKRAHLGGGPGPVWDAVAGDFVHVPAFTVHRESNPTDEPSVAVIARAGGGIPTVNVAPPERAAREAVVGRQGQEVGVVVGEGYLEEEFAGRLRSARVVAEFGDLLGGDLRTSSAVAVSPFSKTTRCDHCQIWEREISAVAASSIRLKMATAPSPRSQASM